MLFPNIDFNTFNPDDPLEFINRYELKKKSGWFIPHMLARFAELPVPKTNKGLYSGKALVLDYINKTPELKALRFLARMNSRSYLTNDKAFCSLVPLLPAAFKKLRGIGYNEWDREEFLGLIPENLAEAITWDGWPSLGREEKLDLQRLALNGKRAETTFALKLPKDHQLYGIPNLTLIMLTQSWNAHSTNRNQYMILDPMDLDAMPEPLVTAEVTKKNWTEW